MDTQKSIQILQAYATGLAAQSLQHRVQSKVFASKGFSKLGSKYSEHDEEEDMYWSEQQIELAEKIGLQNWLTAQL